MLLLEIVKLFHESDEPVSRVYVAISVVSVICNMFNQVLANTGTAEKDTQLIHDTARCDMLSVHC